MVIQTYSNLKPIRTTPITPVRSRLLQCKCARRGSPDLDDECDECPRKRLASQPPLLQTKLQVSQPGDLWEQEAERIAAQVTHGAELFSSPTHSLSAAEPTIRRQAADEGIGPGQESSAPTETAETPTAPVSEPEPAPAEPTAEPTPETATREAAPSAGLIIEDEAPEMAPGQMRKNAFLDELRTAVCAAADAELAAVGRSTQGCPYLARWIGYYRTKDSAHIERAIRKYAPEAVGATSAREYIPLVSERVRRGVATWATTGQITGVPEELAITPPGAGATGSTAATPAATGSVQFKGRDGRTNEAHDPQAIRAQLGAGSPLEGAVRTRMESAFGYDFSRVRVHTNSGTAALSASLNARAFTIGSDVAFASGEYRPGTLAGEALIAHELAHVVQQGGADSSSALMQKGGAACNRLEEDADVSAGGVILSLWGRAKGGLANVTKSAMPRLRTGMQLSRCGCSSRGGLEWGPFCIVGNAAFQGKVKGHLDTLNFTKQGSGAFSELKADRGNSLIDIQYMSGSAGFIPDKIYYDPDASGPADRCPGSTGAWTTAPRHVYLFHEVSHAYIYYVKGLGTHSERECMATGLGAYFTSTSYNENQLRCELKLPIRPCYDGACTKYPPPTCKT